jgi:NAD(P)-dependent dehydrogenase (short-subunit alcohol dehydrogenase family)
LNEESGMGRLAGKVAVVTGAGQGIGLAIAKVFASEGAKVVVTELVAERLDEALAELRPFGDRVIGVQADAAERADADRAVRTAVGAGGRLDVLVNNAQQYRAPVKVEDIDLDVIKLTFGAGFLGTLNHMQAAFPFLKESRGSIINFGSREGIWPEGGLGVYAAAKEAIRGLSRAAAREWGEHGIRVNVIHPGALSPSGIEYYARNPELKASIQKQMLLKWFGDPEADVAPLALFLATEDSRYLTGQTIGADGGMTMF